jgi:hypothetical protein
MTMSRSNNYTETMQLINTSYVDSDPGRTPVINYDHKEERCG